MKRRREIERELDERWAGCVLLDQLRLAEVCESIIRHAELNNLSRQAIAMELAMTTRRLNQLLHGAQPVDVEWDAAIRWCAGKPVPLIEPEIVYVSGLAHYADPRQVHHVRRMIALAVIQIHAQAGSRLPAWVVEALETFLRDRR